MIDHHPQARLKLPRDRLARRPGDPPAAAAPRRCDGMAAASRARRVHDHFPRRA
ncbi:hypothetical protein ACU4GD_30235 [Cupriavidus basilensis]